MAITRISHQVGLLSITIFISEGVNAKRTNDFVCFSHDPASYFILAIYRFVISRSGVEFRNSNKYVYLLTRFKKTRWLI